MEEDEYDVMAADLTPNAWVKRTEEDGTTSKVRVAAIVKPRHRHSGESEWL